MESNYHEESTNSSEEVGDHSSDQEINNDLGVGRSYECVFCKRGFNTAQALGGHMNIHRKDRARNKPNSTKQQENYSAPRLYHQIIPSSGIRRVSPQDHHQPHHLSYGAYFPAAASSNSTLYESNCHHDRDDDSDRDQGPQPVIPGDWRMRLRLEVEDLEKKNRSLQAMNNQDKELDLELRLGYDS